MKISKWKHTPLVLLILSYVCGICAHGRGGHHSHGPGHGPQGHGHGHGPRHGSGDQTNDDDNSNSGDKLLHFIQQNFDLFVRAFKLLKISMGVDTDLQGTSAETTTPSMEIDVSSSTAQPEASDDDGESLSAPTPINMEEELEPIANDWDLDLDMDESKWNEDLDVILEGVENIGGDAGWSNVITVFGDEAFPILAGVPDNTEWNEDIKTPIAGGAKFGKGRVIAFGSDNLIYRNDEPSDNEQLYLNSVKWVTRADGVSKKTVQILGYGDDEKFQNLVDLIENKYKGWAAKRDNFGNEDAIDFESDALVIPEISTVPDDLIPKLLTYVKNGGGILASNDWSDDFEKINGFLGPTGMSWVRGSKHRAHCEGVWKNRRTFNSARESLKGIHGGMAAREVLKSIQNKTPMTSKSQESVPQTINSVLMYTESKYVPWIETLKKSLMSLEDIHPTVENPLEVTTLNRLVVGLQSFLQNDLLSPEEIKAHPSAKDFPGEVDPSRLGELTQEHIVNISIQNPEKGKTHLSSISVGYAPYGYSTLLYAPAGSKVSIDFLGDSPSVLSFTVKIGCHKDDVSDKDEWLRYPKVTTDQTFSGDSADVASPFGGLIYIENIEIKETDMTVETISLKITGAVTTPSYVYGETSLAEWRDTIRHIKAPWAEFVCDRLILTVPGDLAEGVEDPEELMAYWTNVIDHMSDLIGIEKEKNFHRITFDVQITIGYMHAGYPIMAMMKSAGNSLDLAGLNTNMYDTFSFFHELGHNHQEHHAKAWTLEAGVEVTNEIFAVYVMNQMLNYSIEDTRGSRERSVYNLDKGRKLINDYIQSGLDYTGHYNNNVRLGHLMYYQLLKKFGWDAYKKMFRAYGGIPKDELPKIESERVDKWVTVFSSVVNQNLAGFFKSWGIPFSADAEAEVKDLPECDMTMKDLLTDEY